MPNHTLKNTNTPDKKRAEYKRQSELAIARMETALKVLQERVENAKANIDVEIDSGTTDWSPIGDLGRYARSVEDALGIDED